MTPLHEKPLSDRSPERLKAPLCDRSPAEQQPSVAVAERREALPVDDTQRTQVIDGDGTQRQSVAGIGHVADNSASRAALVADEAILSVLQHSLGVDQFGRSTQYRRHFVCGEGHHSYAACCEAVAQGLMIRREVTMYAANGSTFLVTDEGCAWMAANSPAPPKLTRSQQRYQRYLDADCSMTFREWLDYDKPDPVNRLFAALRAAPSDTDEVPF